jgi:hypothetical protein
MTSGYSFQPFSADFLISSRYCDFWAYNICAKTKQRKQARIISIVIFLDDGAAGDLDKAAIAVVLIEKVVLIIITGGKEIEIVVVVIISPYCCHSKTLAIGFHPSHCNREEVKVIVEGIYCLKAS